MPVTLVHKVEIGPQMPTKPQGAFIDILKAVKGVHDAPSHEPGSLEPAVKETKGSGLPLLSVPMVDILSIMEKQPDDVSQETKTLIAVLRAVMPKDFLELIRLLIYFVNSCVFHGMFTAENEKTAERLKYVVMHALHDKGDL